MRKLLPILFLFASAAWAQDTVRLCDKDNPSRCAVVDADGNLSVIGGDISVTVSDTVDLGTTDSTHLSEIEGAVETIETSIHAEDAVHSSGAFGTPVWAVRKDTAAALAADGDYHPLEMDDSGNLYVYDDTLNTGLSILTATKTTISATDGLRVFLFDDNDAQMTSVPVTLSSFPDNEPFNVAQWAGATAVGGTGNVTSGTARVVIASDQTAYSIKLQDGSGNAITSTSDALDVNIASGVTVDVAEDAAAGTYPVIVGSQALLVEKTAMSDASDAVRNVATMTGVPVISHSALPGDKWQESLEITDTTWTVLEAAPGAGYYLCVTHISVMNGDAAVSTDVHIYNDDDGDVGDSDLIYQGHAALAGGGFVDNNPDAVFCSETANEAIYAVCETTSSETHINVRGYRTKVAPQY